MYYFFRSVPADHSLESSFQMLTIRPTRRRYPHLASCFQGLPEAQNANEGRSHCLGTRRQRGTHGAATVTLVEVGARRERHVMFLQQRLAPGFRVGVLTELATDARVDIEG